MKYDVGLTPLDKSEKRGRGYAHNVTGRLLCPAQYDWDDPEYVNHFNVNTY